MTTSWGHVGVGLCLRFTFHLVQPVKRTKSNFYFFCLHQKLHELGCVERKKSPEVKTWNLFSGGGDQVSYRGDRDDYVTVPVQGVVRFSGFISSLKKRL